MKVGEDVERVGKDIETSITISIRGLLLQRGERNGVAAGGKSGQKESMFAHW